MRRNTVGVDYFKLPTLSSKAYTVTRIMRVIFITLLLALLLFHVHETLVPAQTNFALRANLVIDRETHYA